MDKDLRGYIGRTVIVNVTTAGGEPVAFRGTLVAVGRSSVTVDRAETAGGGEARALDGVLVVPVARLDWVQVV